MSTSVTSYSVGLTLDASNYIRNSALSRKETSQLQRTINASRSPADRYARSIEQIDNALKKGAIDLRTHATLTDRLRDKFEKTKTTVDSLRDSVTGYIKAYAGLQGVQMILRGVRDRMQEIDAVAKAARGIGENANQLQRFQFAAAEIAGVDSQLAMTMLTKLNQRVGEAALGMGEAGKHFEALGLDVQKLNTMTPVEQFRELANAIGAIENPTEQAAYATKFFEESGSKLLPLLSATNEQYANSANQVDKLGLAISSIDVENIEATNDALNRLSSSLKGIYQQFAANGTVSTAINQLSRLISMGGALNDLINFSSSGGDAAKLKGISDRLGLTPEQFQGKTWEELTAPPKPPEPVEPPASAAVANAEPGEIGTLIGSSIDAGMEKLRTGAGGLMSVVGAVQSAGAMVAMSGVANTQELITSMQDDPAIAALEEGSQEAYKFITQATLDSDNERRKEAANQKILAENAEKQREKTNQWLTRINDALEKNGFHRIR